MIDQRGMIGLVAPILLFIGASTLVRSTPQSLFASATTPTASSADFQAKSRQVSQYVVIDDRHQPPPVRSTSFLLLDQASNEVLVSRLADSPLPVASTTKMVTALVARELLALDAVVTVPLSATKVAGSKVNLLAGEKITVHNLLKALLIQSGNDAAYALASATAEDTDQFVTRMNQYLASHRLRQTKFTDPAGLDDQAGRSTAFELSQIARLLLQDRLLAEIVTVGKATITSVNGLTVHQLTNSNRLVLGDSPYFLPSALGIKTGYTDGAGHCLVAAYMIKGRVVIGVILSTTEASIEASAKEMRKLFLWAESRLEVREY